MPDPTTAPPLVIDLLPGDRIVIAHPEGDVIVQCLFRHGEAARLGVQAPADWPIDRGEDVPATGGEAK